MQVTAIRAIRATVMWITVADRRCNFFLTTLKPVDIGGHGWIIIISSGYYPLDTDRDLIRSDASHCESYCYGL